MSSNIVTSTSTSKHLDGVFTDLRVRGSFYPNGNGLASYSVMANPTGATGPAIAVTMQTDNTILGHPTGHNIRSMTIQAPLGVTGTQLAILPEGVNATLSANTSVGNASYIFFDTVNWSRGVTYNPLNGRFTADSLACIYSISATLYGNTGTAGIFQIRDTDGNVYGTLNTPLQSGNGTITGFYEIPASKVFGIYNNSGGSISVYAGSTLSVLKYSPKNA